MKGYGTLQSPKGKSTDSKESSRRKRGFESRSAPLGDLVQTVRTSALKLCFVYGLVVQLEDRRIVSPMQMWVQIPSQVLGFEA